MLRTVRGYRIIWSSIRNYFRFRPISRQTTREEGKVLVTELWTCQHGWIGMWQVIWSRDPLSYPWNDLKRSYVALLTVAWWSRSVMAYGVICFQYVWSLKPVTCHHGHQSLINQFLSVLSTVMKAILVIVLLSLLSRGAINPLFRYSTSRIIYRMTD